MREIDGLIFVFPGDPALAESRAPKTLGSSQNPAYKTRRLNREVEGVTGITLYLQPVQDLTIDTTVSRTQYQFVLGTVDVNQLATWTTRLVQKLLFVMSP